MLGPAYLVGLQLQDGVETTIAASLALNLARAIN